MLQTIEDFSKCDISLSVEELTELIKSSFGDRAPDVVITKATRIDEFPEHIQWQIKLQVWAYTKD